MQNLSKVKELEDLKEEETKLRQELNEKKKGISENARKRMIDTAFDEFKTFFEERGFTPRSTNHLRSSYRSLLVNYKSASYSIWYINQGLHVKHGADGSSIFSVGIKERIGRNVGTVSAFGSTKLDTDIELAKKEIDNLNYSLLNIDKLVCVYTDGQSGSEYESFTNLLESHFK